MRVFLIAIACLVMGATLGLASAKRERAADRGLEDFGIVSERKPGAAKVMVEGGESFDFGTMAFGTTQKHEFVIRNDGDVPLTLKPGEPTCQCTISKLVDRVVKPGEKTTATLHWTAKKPEEEMFSQGVDIETNAPQLPHIRLRVSGRVIRAIRAVPDAVPMTVSASEGGRGTMLILANNTDDFQVKQHEFTNAASADSFSAAVRQLTAEELQERQAKSGVEITVTAKRGLPLGALDQKLRIITNLPNAEPLEYKVEGRVTSNISLIGPKVSSEGLLINLETIPEGQGIKLTGLFLTVKGPHRDEVQLKIKSITPAAVVKAQLDSPLGLNTGIVRHPLVVEIPPEAPRTNCLGTEVAPTARIVLETTHPDVPEVIVRVRFAIE